MFVKVTLLTLSLHFSFAYHMLRFVKRRNRNIESVEAVLLDHN